MRALVTGGAGLIGSHIVDKLVLKGLDVVILDNLENETHRGIVPSWINKKSKLIVGDVRDRRVLNKALNGVDIVFHQAAYGGFSTQLSKYIEANALGTLNIYELIKEKKHKVKKIVFASSQAVYGEGKYKCKKHGVCFPQPRELPQLVKGKWEMICPRCKSNLQPIATDEKKPVNPAHIYSISKYAEERIGLLMGRQLDIPSVALRYSVTYGPRQSLFNPYTGVCSIFSTMILNNVPPVIYEDGKQTRDFVYVGDVADANIFVGFNSKADHEVFNVGYGKPIKVLDFVSTLSKQYKKDVKPTLRKEFRPGDVRHLFSDNKKLSKIGFTPSTSLESGIKNYVSWIQSQGKINEYFSKAWDVMVKKGIVKQAN